MPRDTNFLAKGEFTRPRNNWPSGSTLLDRIAHFSNPMPNGCVEWQGAFTGSGRPFLKVGSEIWTAYRLVWIWHRGRIPTGKIIRHVGCANKRCVNVDHLAVGTHFENAQDRDRDGNTVRGTKHHRALLTEEQVAEIILHRESHRDAAKKYNVGVSTITNIRLGNSWKHLPRPPSR